MAQHTLLREVIKSDLDTWTKETLAPLKGTELALLCSLLGIPYTGSSERKLDRVVYCAALSYRLRRYDRSGEGRTPESNIQQFSEALSGKEFAAICKTIGIYKPSTKYGCAAALFNWRRNCIRRGRAYLEMVQKSRISKTKQLWMF